MTVGRRFAGRVQPGCLVRASGHHGALRCERARVFLGPAPSCAPSPCIQSPVQWRGGMVQLCGGTVQLCGSTFELCGGTFELCAATLVL